MFPSNKPILIGETAAHHQGDPDFLIHLVDEGIKAGVDYLKFHLIFNLSDYYVRNHVAYESSLARQLTKEKWIVVQKSLSKNNIKPIFLCNDVTSMQWVNSLPENSVMAVEIHATGINDVFLLKEAAKFEGTVILAAGGSSLDEFYYAIRVLKENNKNDILLMHGFQNYPTDYKEIVFSRMNLLKNIFNLPVGYADHTDPSDPLNAYISCLPQAMGFNILEKHFTHVPNEKRIDSQSAVSIDKLKEIRKLMDIVYETHGTDPMKMSEAEQKYGDTGPMKKAIVAKNDLPMNHIIDINDIAFKRTNQSVPIKQKDIHLIIGGTTKSKITADTPLTFENISYLFKEGETKQFFIHKK